MPAANPAIDTVDVVSRHPPRNRDLPGPETVSSDREMHDVSLSSRR